MKRFLTLLAFVVTAISSYAYDCEIDGIYYNLYSNYTGNVAEVAHTFKQSKDVVSIPETITYNGTTYTVCSITTSAFSECTDLVSITIPNTVQNIGSYAFSGCSNLTTVSIANSVKSVGENVFLNCSNIRTINILCRDEADFCNYIQRSDIRSVFILADTWRNIYIANEKQTNIVIPNSVTSIGDWAFWGCSSLTSVTIPNSVKSIGATAFYYCTGLTSITIPNSVTSIGSFAFNGCSGLTSVTIGNSVTSIDTYTFQNCKGLTSVTIPNSVTSISGSAFGGCTGLTSVTIPNSVTSMSKYAFEYCSNIKTVNVSCTDEDDFAKYVQRSDIKSIWHDNFVLRDGKHIYINGEEQKSIAIPNSVTSIGQRAFYYCNNLTSVTIPNSVTSIGDQVFMGCTDLTSVTIGQSVSSIGSDVFEECYGLSSLVIDKGNSIYDSRDNCNAIIETSTNTLIKGFNNSTIPYSVTSIGDRAFLKCTGLTSVTIPNSVTSIGSSAFDGCKGLTSVTIGNSVTSIGSSAFASCEGLTSVTIGNSVTNIMDYAFSYCSALTSVTIGNSVKSIGKYAFYRCKGLRFVYCYATEVPSANTDYYAASFNEVPIGSVTLYVPSGSLQAYKSTAPWKNFKNIVGLNPITEISISVGSNELIVGEKTTLTATVLPEDASVKTVTWSSSDTNVATVDATTGEVTAVGEGTATITATAADGSGVTGTCEITVKAAQSGSGTVDVTPRPTSGNYMYVEKQTVKPGQAVQIPVELVVDEQYEEEIVGFQCNIKLPEGFDFVKNSKGNAVITLNQDRIDGHSVTSMLKADGTLNIGCASMSLGAFTDLDGAIMYVSVMAKEGMADGEYAMQISNVRLSTEDEEIQCPTITQALEVKNFTLGDLNDDGDWTILDVTLTIKHMLEETYTEAGDMNGDGSITILDVTKVIQYMLNEGPVEAASAPAAKKMAKVAAKDSQKLYAENLYIEPGTQQTLTVNAHLNTEDYVGCQLEMQLPEGFSYVTNKKGAVVVTPNSYRCETHSASVKLVDSRTLRIGIASMSLDPIYFGEDGDESLFTVKVQADASVEAGNHEISITKVRFSTEEVEDQFAATEGYFRAFGEEAISLVVPEGGYATLCLPYNATVPAGLKAYKATGMKNGMVVIEEQTSIAACIPMIIEGTAGTYNFSGDNSDADEFEYSVGSLKSSLVPAESSNGYVLQNLSEGLGFYKIADALTVPSFRCVLDGASVSAAPAFVPVGFDEDANAIEAIGNNPQTTGSVYTLDGKRVKTMEKGKIYVVGGVKMIVK